MNSYCEGAFHHLKAAVATLVEIIDTLEEGDLSKRPTPDKFSIGELLEHTVLLLEADWHISNQATKLEMEKFYSTASYPDLPAMKKGLLENYEALKEHYSRLSETELQEETTSHWGVTYTRFEWLLEILVHVYHHRGQLHAMLVHCEGKDPKILMFE